MSDSLGWPTSTPPGVEVDGDGFRLTPIGAALLILFLLLAVFYYATPVPGPRVGRIRAILGPRPRRSTTAG